MSLRRLWLAGLFALGAASLAAAQETATAAPAEGAAETEEEPETKTKPPLTGNPQIDYKYDPNLPHEVIGYDLSDYPFYSKLPKDLLDPKFNFTCDDRHDGFYASVPHKCQVYHNCLFGVRYDFLCANYTVFDQKNFICHYVSEVDCVNSEKHYDRNDDLYETTTTTTTTRAPPQIIYVDRPPPIRGLGRTRPPRLRPPFGDKGKRRTTTTTPQPIYYDDYEYYDYYDPYYDDYYNDYVNERTTTTTTTTTQRPRRRPNRPRGNRPRGGGDRFGGGFNNRERKRPRIKPPVLQGERGSGPRASRLQQPGTPREQTFNNPPQNTPTRGRRRRPGRPGAKRGPRRKPTTTTTTESSADDYYYDDYYAYDYDEEKSTTTTTAAPSRRGHPSRNRPDGTGQRRRSGRPDPTVATTTSTTTEAPLAEERSSNRGRPGRVNTRVKPLVITRRVSQAEPEEIVDEAPSAQRQRPQRTGPKFPTRRSQGVAPEATSDAEIIEEEAPLAPEVRLSPERTSNDQTAGDASAPEESSRVRRPRPGRQGSLRPSGRRRVQARGAAPDDYDY